MPIERKKREKKRTQTRKIVKEWRITSESLDTALSTGRVYYLYVYQKTKVLLRNHFPSLSYVYTTSVPGEPGRFYCPIYIEPKHANAYLLLIPEPQHVSILNGGGGGWRSPMTALCIISFLHFPFLFSYIRRRNVREICFPHLGYPGQRQNYFHGKIYRRSIND
jgi:hypothetical protein